VASMSALPGRPYESYTNPLLYCVFRIFRATGRSWHVIHHVIPSDLRSSERGISDFRIKGLRVQKCARSLIYDPSDGDPGPSTKCLGMTLGMTASRHAPDSLGDLQRKSPISSQKFGIGRVRKGRSQLSGNLNLAITGS
jgi:hypothetical protein